jgi:predicted dehydrogenase
MGTTRRHFLAATAATGMAGSLLGKQSSGGSAKSANDNVQIALIGAGGQGMGDCEASQRVGGVKLVAVSDIYEGRLTRARELWGKDIVVARDYREVLARPDVDAVIIGTPDHWHQRISIDAMMAGKDVYCEKPMVQHVEDGASVIAAQKNTHRILQVGSQRVSSILYQKAKEIYESGAIGNLNMVEAWWDRNSAIGAWQYSIPPDASPETIDWDRFLGRAPRRPFDPVRLFRWRNYQDYGTGVAGDLFVHLFSGMHFITSAIGPDRVYATGGTRFWKDGRDVPDLMFGMYDYAERPGKHPAFNLALRVNFEDGGSENSGFRFIGSEGIMTVGDSVGLTRTPRETEPGYTIGTFSKAIQKKFLEEYRAKYPAEHPTADSIRPDEQERFFAPDGYSDHFHHHQNFIAAVRSRKPVVEDAVFGFRAAGPALLSNLSYFGQRVCEWNPEKMSLAGGKA